MNRLGEELVLVELIETVDDVEDEEAPLVHSCRCGSLGSPTGPGGKQHASSEKTPLKIRQSVVKKKKKGVYIQE